MMHGNMNIKFSRNHIGDHSDRLFKKTSVIILTENVWTAVCIRIKNFTRGECVVWSCALFGFLKDKQRLEITEHWDSAKGR